MVLKSACRLSSEAATTRVVGATEERIVYLEAAVAEWEVFVVRVVEVGTKRVVTLPWRVVQPGYSWFDAARCALYVVCIDDEDDACCLKKIDVSAAAIETLSRDCAPDGGANSGPRSVFASWGEARPEASWPRGFLMQTMVAHGTTVYATGVATASSAFGETVEYGSEMVLAFEPENGAVRLVAGGARRQCSVDGIAREASFFAICKTAVSKSGAELVVLDAAATRSGRRRSQTSHVRTVDVSTGAVKTLHTVFDRLVVDLDADADGNVYYATTLGEGAACLRVHVLDPHGRPRCLVDDLRANRALFPSVTCGRKTHCNKGHALSDVIALDDKAGVLTVACRDASRGGGDAVVVALKVPGLLERYRQRVLPIVLAFHLLDNGRAALPSPVGHSGDDDDDPSFSTPPHLVALRLLAECQGLREHLLPNILAFAYAPPDLRLGRVF